MSLKSRISAHSFELVKLADKFAEEITRLCSNDFHINILAWLEVRAAYDNRTVGVRAGKDVTHFRVFRYKDSAFPADHFLFGFKFYPFADPVQLMRTLHGKPGVEVSEGKGFRVRPRGITGDIYLFRAVFFYPFDSFFEIFFSLAAKADDYVGKKGEVFETGTEFCNDCIHCIHFMQAVHTSSVRSERRTG